MKKHQESVARGEHLFDHFPEFSPPAAGRCRAGRVATLTATVAQCSAAPALLARPRPAWLQDVSELTGHYSPTH